MFINKIQMTDLEEIFATCISKKRLMYLIYKSSLETLRYILKLKNAQKT